MKKRDHRSMSAVWNFTCKNKLDLFCFISGHATPPQTVTGKQVRRT